MRELLATLQQWFSQVVFWVIVAPWESALRVRCGKHVKVLPAGIHWRIPLFDAVYRQSVRMRMGHISTQTLSTKDGRTLIVGSVLGYEVIDIERLYERLHHAEDTLTSLAAAAIAGHVQRCDHETLCPRRLAEVVSAELTTAFDCYGLGEVSVRITDFAFIRAYRIVQDYRCTTHSDFLDTMKQAGA